MKGKKTGKECNKFENELKRALSILDLKLSDRFADLNDSIKNILLLPELPSQKKINDKCLVDCISKLSAFVSNRIEHSLIEYLNDTRPDKTVMWARFEGKFPDLQVIDTSTSVSSEFGIEIKVICGLCEEPSARFWHATENFTEYGRQFISILVWNLSNRLTGFPQLTNSISIDAKKLAEDRDVGIHQPPHRLVSLPNKKNNKTKKNIKQTDIKVMIFQGDESQMQSANDMVSKANTKDKPWEQSQRTLTELLLSNFPYREDSNTGKLNRIQNVELGKFIKSIKKQP